MNISDLVFDFIDTVAFMVQDPEIWDNSNPISIPRDIFNGKSFQYLLMKLNTLKCVMAKYDLKA